MPAVFVPYAVAHLRLTGALIATRLLRRLPFGVVVALGPLSGLRAAAILALTVVLPMPALAATGFLFLGVGPILWVVSTTTLRQAVTPAALLGRARPSTP